MRLGVADGNRTRDLLHCRRTLYAKSHSNGVTEHYLGTSVVLLQLPPKPRWRKLLIGIVAERGGPNSKAARPYAMPAARPYAMPYAKPKGWKAGRLQVLLRLRHHVGVTTM
jgi:hypothetical protein